MLSYRSMRYLFGLFAVFAVVLMATKWSYGQASALVLPPSTAPVSSSPPMPTSMPGMPPGSPMGGMPGSMGPMGGMGGAGASVAPAGPSSAPNDIQALIYPDVERIVRIDTRRIDYVSLKQFTDDLVQYGIGSLKLDDKYLVKLRETQKEKLKVAFGDAIAKLQSKFDRDMAPLGVREYYRLRYVKGTEFCGCLAFPLGGVSAQQQMQLRNYVEKEYSPLAVFERFGFLIVIDDHTIPVATGATGKSDEEDEEEDEYDTYEKIDVDAAVSAGLSGLFGGIFVNTDNNNKQQKSPREQKKLDDKKKAIYPRLVSRFSKPAGPGNEMVAAAFIATEGANLTYVMKDVEAIQENLIWIKTNGFDLPLDGITGSLNTNQSKLNWSAFCLSLVKEPRAILLIDFTEAGIANLFGTVLKTVLTASQGSYDTFFNDQLKSLELDNAFATNPFIPIVSLLFESMQVRNSGTQVALILETKAVLDQAYVLVPLFGGVPVAREKTAKTNDSGDEEVDFDDEESESPASKPPQKAKTDDDPFA